ncbi:forkhead box protein J1-B-like [Carettochelys insculpta]|uniref:forkhead box protein J1-B-like n=1 Tax=Carettochelys insculpta TaxID=44489 RepID=UPI003EBCAC77
MPVRASPDTAAQFQEKWLPPPEDWDRQGGAAAVDDSLTSLQWLQDFSIITADPERPPVPSHPLHQLFPGAEAPASPPAGDTAATGMPLSLGKPTATATSPGTSSLPSLGAAEEIDYKTNPGVKPPYSYATLICMALQASKQAKVTLSAIYSWIRENFCYYRLADPSWQNSIRHNLSLNKCFRKVPRQKDEPGKGGFWQLDPRHTDKFVDGVLKRRRAPGTPCSQARQRSPEAGCSPLSPVPRLANCQPLQQPGPGGLPWGTPGPQEGPPRKQGRPAARTAPAPLPPSGGCTAEAPGGDFAWADAVDDVLQGNGSTFEELDINTVLSSLAAGAELAGQVDSRYLPPPTKWGATDHPSPGAAPWEDSPPFADALRHPWEEVKGEALGSLWGFDFCDGFLGEPQPWDKADACV